MRRTRASPAPRPRSSVMPARLLQRLRGLPDLRRGGVLKADAGHLLDVDLQVADLDPGTLRGVVQFPQRLVHVGELLAPPVDVEGEFPESPAGGVADERRELPGFPRPLVDGFQVAERAGLLRLYRELLRALVGFRLAAFARRGLRVIRCRPGYLPAAVRGRSRPCRGGVLERGAGDCQWPLCAAPASSSSPSGAMPVTEHRQYRRRVGDRRADLLRGGGLRAGQQVDPPSASRPRSARSL